MRIICFTKYDESGASSRYRTYQYVPIWRELGYEVIVNSTFNESNSEFTSRSVGSKILRTLMAYTRRLTQLIDTRATDIVFIEKELFPYVPLIEHLIFNYSNRKIVLDYDDAIFHNYDESNFRIIKLALKRKLPGLMLLSSAVVTGSPYLTKFATAYNSNVIEIPTSITFSKYAPSRYQRSCRINKLSDPFVIGWIGSKSTTKHLLSVLPALGEVCENFNAVVHAVGDKSSLQSHCYSWFQAIQWTAENEQRDIANFDVGIMPLVINSFSKGKCGFKLIQYMASGAPTISTPTETNISIDKFRLNVFANSHEEWVAGILDILRNNESYIRVGKRNQDITRDYYSTEANARKYISLFSSL